MHLLYSFTYFGVLCLFSLQHTLSIRITPHSLSTIYPQDPLKKPRCGSHFFKGLSNYVRQAVNIAKLELYVDDVNVMLKCENKKERLLIVLEYGDAFDRNFSLNKTEDGNSIRMNNSDKVLLPEELLSLLLDENVRVPWQFIIQKVHRVTQLGRPLTHTCVQSTVDDFFSARNSHNERISCASFDFRAQDNFIFIPKWMMKSLNIRPYDIIYLSHIQLLDATYVKIMPMEKEFFDLKEPKLILEQHLKHYSTLTRGAIIPISHKNRLYNLKVVSINTEKKQNIECASIQDIDVAVDLVRAI
ncbi:signal peptide containing protein [Theileria equi strain WA]|uniref:Signal peptide containing protein n=1 Tax=Theileria equi strain WA TaxID=1537102 RepID=L1LG23_THEEQ|nr:signal peptide containing protein [Theileria equi strain WA]EKX74291.1 signal peptide containing protein [Theileria equi strain WA]|eukprot:XP_004833743.1 signal peptide containing protein [Theileria equi strain WA]